MSAGTTAERIERLDEYLRAQGAKLDIIIRLTEAQDQEIKALKNEMARIAPTVKAGEEVFTTARNIGGLAKWTFWIATGFVAFLVYMADRWHVVGQLFRKAT